MIEMKNIKKSFGKDTYQRILFDNFSFEIKKGEMVAIMGKSGCGKTTLLNIIGGLESLTSGDYLFEGKNVSSFNEKEYLEFRRKHISYIFQNYALIPEYSVLENIILPVCYRIGNKKKAKINAKKLLKELDIEYLENRSIDKLSGGEKQRIAIARSLITNSNLILADEPTGSLDATTGKIIMELLKEINKQGKTIVIVTHDIEVANYCDRIINLNLINHI